MQKEGSKDCVDVNECENAGTNDCSNEQKCENTVENDNFLIVATSDSLFFETFF